MDLAFNIIVIILSCLLAIFLVLSIIVAVMAIKVVGSVKRVVAKSEQVIDTAEAAAEVFKKASGPIGVVRALANIVETITKTKRGKE